MDNCTHHWTVTSPCPFCQQEEIRRLRRILREYATRVPIAYKEGHAELMRETWEILDNETR